MKKVNNYFPHDFNARNDLKLKKVIMQLGLEGIGLYWCIVEYLYENGGYLSLDEDVDFIAYELRIDKSLIIDLIENYDLFKKNKNKFYSQSVLKRLEAIAEKSNKNRQNILKRWRNTGQNEDTNVLRNEYDRNTNVLQSKYYIKENKKKEKKINIYNTSLTTTDNNIYSFIEKNFGRLLSMIEIEKIDIWMSEYGTDIIKYAITIAIMNQKKTFAYVEGILKNWKGKGFKTLEEIKENEVKSVNSNNSSEDNYFQNQNDLFDYNWLEDAQ